jgi:hypothetical protein
MSTLETLSFPQISELEQIRQSKVLVLAASMLDMEFLPNLYDVLTDIGHTERLDVVLYGLGGEINADRRIALLLHEFTDNLSFIVPHHCQSACTILALSGQQIIAGDVALFSPIDPRLNSAGEANDDSPGAIASEDIRLFCKMSEDWFGIEGEDVRSQLLSSLAGSIFPTTLTSLYRSTLELKSIAEELLGYQLGHQSSQQRTKIVEQLLFGYHSHSFALTGDNLAQIGLEVARDKAVEKLAWAISAQLRAVIGGGARQTPQDPRNDVLLATSDHVTVRRRYPGIMAPVWESLELTS